MNVNGYLKQLREGHSPSKAEEMELLEQLHLDHVQHGNSYLASLFTDGFTEWANRHIDQDLSTDMYGELRQAQMQRDGEVERLQAEISDLQRQLEVADLDLREMASEKDRIAEDRDNILDVRDEQDREEKRLLERINGFEAMSYQLRELAMGHWFEDEGISPIEIRNLLQKYYPEA